MHLTILGSGDAFGSGGRFNTCFHVVSEGARILIDCGASSLVAMKARGVAVNSIDAIVLSHLHGDHFGGLPFFLLESQFHARRDRPLVIAGPPGTRTRLHTLMEAFFPNSNANKWRFALEIFEIAIDVPTTIVGFHVRSIEVVHQSGAPSTALRIARNGKVLAYSGDTEWTEALIGVADGADLLIQECYDFDRDLPGHMSFARLERERPHLRARRIMLTHMNPTMLAKVAEARAAGYLVADDGLSLDV